MIIGDIDFVLATRGGDDRENHFLSRFAIDVKDRIVSDLIGHIDALTGQFAFNDIDIDYLPRRNHTGTGFERVIHLRRADPAHFADDKFFLAKAVFAILLLI